MEGRGRPASWNGLSSLPDCPYRAISPAPRSSSHLKPFPGLHPVTLPSSPLPLRTSGPQNSTSAPLPQVNGGFRVPPYQLLEASEPPPSLCKKRKRNRSGETQERGSEREAAAPPGKKRKKKRKRPEDSDSSPQKEGQLQGQHRDPERRKEGRAELLADRLEEEGGQHLVNGWQVGCGTDSPHVSNKKRRKGTEGLGREDCLHQGPPWHR